MKRCGAVSGEIHLGRSKIVIAQEWSGKIGETDAPVVIDTLRGSSTIVTALASGVEEIIPVRQDEEAFNWRRQGRVIAGESNGVKLAGYDLGNSPVELLARVEQKPFKTMAFKTSNLIPLLCALPYAWICTSLNMGAIAARLSGRNVCLIAANGEHGVSEDLAVAVALHARFNGIPFDESLIAYFIRESPAAAHLAAIGYAEDVRFIARVNVYDIIPFYDGKTIKKDSLNQC